MKIKIFLAMWFIASLTACSTDNKEEYEAHETHAPEGVVVLNEKQQKALALKLGTIQMRNLTTVVKTNGQLKVAPASSADITAIVGGNVKSIKVFHGDKVSKGQVLAVLEHPDYISLQEDFSQLANSLQYLEKEYERQKELFDNQVGAGKDFQKAKADYQVAKSKFAGLKSRLQLLNLSPKQVIAGTISNSVNILSPIEGSVNEVNIKIGTYVDAKNKMFEITNNKDIHADFMIYEKDVHLIKKGQKIHFTVANRQDKEFTAEIFAIGQEFESNTRAIHIHAKINEAVSGLIPGMYISGHLHTDENYTPTLPNDAIVAEGTKSFIFVLENLAFAERQHEHEEGENEAEEPQKAFKMVEVITGQKDEGYTEVKLIDSLPENTQIVLNAAYYLLADMKKEETEHEH